MQLFEILREAKNKEHREYIWIVVKRKIQTQAGKFFVRYFDIAPQAQIPYQKLNKFIPKMKLYAGTEQNDEVLLFFNHHQERKVDLLLQADKILNHRFNLLGSGEVFLGEKIDWHCDFISGYHWPLKYYPYIENEMAGNDWFLKKADIKIPWELSRFHHLVLLGQAFYLSGDEKYTREFISEIEDWMTNNPPSMGVNWTCNMDVSLRAVNLIIAYFYFRPSVEVSQHFWERYFNLLFTTGVHIEKNQEVRYNGQRNNHYLISCAAMLWLGIFFEGVHHRADRWIKNGYQKMIREMKYQVNADGGSFEGSISYHRYALETFLLTTIMAENNGLVFPVEYIKRLEKMCEFCLCYTKPNGMAPQFGDSDDGRFAVLSGYGTQDIRDHRHLLGIAGEYFKRDDFLQGSAGSNLDGLWVFGRQKAVSEISEANLKLIKFEDTGYFIIRSKDLFLMIKCGQIGQRKNGGHDHNDQLSFELNIGGVDLIIDPGTYVYSQDNELRHLFRSTQYHNISQLNNLELNLIKNETMKDLFSLYSSNPGICTFFEIQSDSTVMFAGRITIADTKIQYQRTLKFNHTERIIEVFDEFGGSEEKGVCCLHLDEKIDAAVIASKTVRIGAGPVSAIIKTESPVSIEPGLVSPSYGVKREALVVSWPFSGRTSFQISY